MITVHAPRDGDAKIGEQVATAAEAGRRVTVVTADRSLRRASPAQVLSPSWLLDRI